MLQVCFYDSTVERSKRFWPRAAIHLPEPSNLTYSLILMLSHSFDGGKLLTIGITMSLAWKTFMISLILPLVLYPRGQALTLDQVIWKVKQWF